MMREREARRRAEAGVVETSEMKAVLNPIGRVFWIGVILCLISGVAGAGANLGYDYADHIERAMKEVAPGTPLEWKATLVRWMPMYWGGISALTLLMGGAMLKNGTWRNFFAPGSSRDFVISASMGFVHFLAQIPYGIGAFYLGTLGTTVGWGVNIGLASHRGHLARLLHRRMEGSQQVRHADSLRRDRSLDRGVRYPGLCPEPDT